jgi:hypothetical protein
LPLTSWALNADGHKRGGAARRGDRFPIKGPIFNTFRSNIPSRSGS